MGGTTTDIAFWENGLPLMAKHGAVVNNYPTSVRSFHMRSVAAIVEFIKQSQAL